jgi:hypothetical protein
MKYLVCVWGDNGAEIYEFQTILGAQRFIKQVNAMGIITTTNYSE